MAISALIGTDAPKAIKDALREYGFALYELERDRSLPSPIASHADTIAFTLGKKIFISKDYLSRLPSLYSTLADSGFDVIGCEKSLGSRYPEDIAYNVATVGKTAFGKFDFVAAEIKEELIKSGFSLCNVKQGYAKCSTLVLNESALITADAGIAKAARECEIEVLLVSEAKNEIALAGYAHGFIGGASGVLRDTVFFCGNAKLHPDFEKIKGFCEGKGIKIVSLCSSPIYDVGGILFL